ncbi:porin [Sphingobacteriaceae bacterium]|nr:porin [Sphingobacteriaceae bacterium]
MNRAIYLFSTVFTLLSGLLFAQDPQTKAPYFSYKNGLGFATPDSSYSLNIRFRIQNRALMNTQSDNDFAPGSFEARVRRCRLVLTGHVLNPKLSYYMQLSFARGDMDWSVADVTSQNVSPNVLRDAMIFYRPSKHLLFGFGQGKLPGNRQRINSSGALQFYDRSLVNVNFTTDRDFGFFTTYTIKTKSPFTTLLKGAITSGEGRNSNISNYGLAYTGRVEVLPFGAFTDGGDFFEGDLAREPKPKLSIAAGYMFNDMAVRTGGQLGKDLYGQKSFNLYFADLIFKYRGFSFLSEYMRRDANSPYLLGTDNKMHLITTGDGLNNQVSYCFKSMWELALRQTLVSPHHDVIKGFNQAEQYAVGVSKYLNKHKVKVQFNLLYNKERNLATQKDISGYYTAVFQLELGI